MNQIIKLILAIFLLTAFTNAQGKKSIEGVWKLAEIVVTGSGAATASNPQPGLIFFGKKHYSFMYVGSDKERPIYAGAAPTPEEKIAAFDSLIASSGNYEIAGTSMVIRPVVARNPGFAGGGFATYQFKLEGKTLWLTIKSSDFNFRVGDKVLPLGGALSETRMKLSRLE